MPRTVTSTESTLAMAKPSMTPTVPAGSVALSWSAMAKSGLGKFRYSPAASIMRAPTPVSSAGWPTSTTVPDQRSLSAARVRAAPTRQVMCTSCPQACITGTSCPARFFVRRVLA